MKRWMVDNLPLAGLVLLVCLDIGAKLSTVIKQIGPVRIAGYPASLFLVTMLLHPVWLVVLVILILVDVTWLINQDWRV